MMRIFLILLGCICGLTSSAQTDTTYTATPPNRGGIWRQMKSGFDPGIVNDSTRGSSYNGGNYEYVFTALGEYTFAQGGIYANGLDMTSQLQQLANRSYAKTLVVSSDSGRGFVINGSVNLHGKILKFSQGCYITGSGTLDSAVIDAPSTNLIFSPTITLTNPGYTGEYFWMSWYTGMPTGVGDFTAGYRKAAAIPYITTAIPKSFMNAIITDSVLYSNYQSHIDFGQVTATQTDRPGWIFGSPGGSTTSNIPWKNTYTVNIVRSTQSTFLPADSMSIGVLFRNSYKCTITITEASNFNVGVQCMGDLFGFSYNEVYLGWIQNNRIGLYLATKGTGSTAWCNQNDFYGGKFGVYSGVNPGVARWGVKVGTDTYLCNNNTFWCNSFELNSSVGTPYWLHAAQGNRALYFRDESNSTVQTVLIDRQPVTNGNFQNKFISGYGIGTMVDNSQTGGNSFENDVNFVLNKTNLVPVISVENIAEQGVYYNGTDSTSVSVAGPISVCSTTGGAPAITSTGMRIIDNYIQVGGGVGLVTKRLWVDKSKIFVVKIKSTAGRGGRFRVRPMNAYGQTVDSTVKIQAYGNNIAWSGTGFGGSWGTQVDSSGDVQFIVPDTIKSVYVYFASGTNVLELQSASVWMTQAGAAENQSRVLPNIDNNPVALQAPLLGNHIQGRLIKNANQGVGQPLGWKTDSTGTLGPQLSGVTGSITISTNKLVLSSGGGALVKPGQYLSINNVPLRIISIVADTAYMESNATATLTGASILFSRPAYRVIGGLSDMFYSGTIDPNGNQNAPFGAVYIWRIGGGTSNIYIHQNGRDTLTGWSLIAGGGGITSLNGLTVSTQTFPTPTTNATGPNWVSSGSTHQLNLPIAKMIHDSLAAVPLSNLYFRNTGTDGASSYVQVNDSTAGFKKDSSGYRIRITSSDSTLIYNLSDSLSYGIYTPTIANTTNVALSTVNQVRYTRIGDVVSVSGHMTVTASASGLVAFTITFPIASDITNGSEVAGGSSIDNTSAILTGRINGSSGLDTAIMNFYATNTNSSLVSFWFTYRVQ